MMKYTNEVRPLANDQEIRAEIGAGMSLHVVTGFYDEYTPSEEIYLGETRISDDRGRTVALWKHISSWEYVKD